jgi:hypothetical protein
MQTQNGDAWEYIVGDLEYTASELGKLVRQVGFGLAGIAFGLLVSDAPFPTVLVAQHKLWLLSISAMGCISATLGHVPT